MSRVENFLCLTILLATLTFFNVASAHVKSKPALPQIEDPTTVNDVESYTVKTVSTFVADLEKECPKTDKFKVFFEKLNSYSKYVCPVSKVKDNESDMKAKAGSLFQAISDLGSVKNGSKGGTGNKSLQREKKEAMNTVKMLQSIGGKIVGEENNKTETIKLTVEQQKEIKDGILKWLQVITQIAKTTEEISLKYSSKNQTKPESKEEKSSTQTQTKITSSRATKAENNDDISKSDRNSTNESDNDKNKKGESKENNGGKEGSQDSANDSTISGDEVSSKSKGDAKEKESSKSKGQSSEKVDDKNHQISYGMIEPMKGGAEQARIKKEERLRAEMADELD